MKLPRNFHDRYAPVTESGCWVWLGSTTTAGYGNCRIDGRYEYVHRLVYQHYVGPIPPLAVVRHMCDTPACVNPNHLVVGSSANNSADMARRGRSLHRFGDDATSKRFSSEDIAAWKEMHKNGLTYADIARSYGTSRGHVRRSINGIVWSQHA